MANEGRSVANLSKTSDVSLGQRQEALSELRRKNRGGEKPREEKQRGGFFSSEKGRKKWLVS